MAGRVQGLYVEINGDATKLKKAMRDAKAEATVLRTHLSSLTKLLNFNPTSTDLIVQKQRLLGQALAQNRATMATYQQAYEKYSGKVGELSAAEVTEFKNLQRQMTNNELEYERLRQQAVEFGAAASQNVLSTKAHFEQLGTTLADVGAKLTVLSAATAAAGYASFKSATDFEDSFTGVAKTVNASEQELEQLAQTSREMALNKPIDVNDINRAMELGGQLGIATENLSKFASVAANLDIATDMDVDDVSLKLAQFMNICNVAETDVDRVGAVITDLGNNSATTESQIMNMAMRIAGSGSNIGMTSQEVLALAASLSSVGIQAEMGGNAISTIMNRIDKDVALNSDTLQVWADTAGMSAEDFAANWKSNVMDTLLAVVDGMATYRDEGGNLNTLLKDMDISYMRQIDTMQRLSRTGDVVNGMVSIANNAWDQNVALTREANRRYGTTTSQLQLVKNNVNELGIEFGQLMIPAVKEASEGAVELVQGFQSLDDATKRNILSLAGIVTAAGPVTLVAGKFFSWLGKITGKFASAYTELAFLTRGTSSFTGAADKAAAASERAALKTEALGRAAAVAKGLVVGLAMAGVALLAAYLVDAARKQENLRKATEGLTDALDDVDEKTKSAADALGSLDSERPKRTFKEIRDSIDQTIQKQAELADDMSETWGGINGSEYALDHYIEVIDKLTGKYDENGQKAKLSADEQANLASAVAGVNELLGTSYQVIDAENGILDTSTDAIRRNADAWVANAKAQAAQEEMVELMKEQFQLEKDLADAKKNQANAQAEYDAALAAGNVPMDSYLTNLANANRAVDDVTKSLDGNTEMQERLKGIYSESSAEAKKLSDVSGELASHMSSLAGQSDDLAAAIEESGYKVEDMAKVLSDAGVSAEDFKNITADQMLEVVRAYDGTYDSVKGILAKIVEENRAKGEEAGQAQADGASSQQGAVDNAYAQLIEGVDYTADAAQSNYQKGEQTGTDIVNGMQSMQDAVAAAADALSKLTADHLSSASEDAWWAGYNMGAEHFAGGIESGRDLAVAEADTASKQVADHFSNSNGDAWWTGYNMAAGFANGISDGTYLATAAAGAVAQAALDKVREVGQEGSPWKTTIRSGRFAAQGLAIGMEQLKGYVADSFGDVARSAVDALNVQAAPLSYEAELMSVGGRANVPQLAIDLASQSQSGTVINNYELKGINVDAAISSERFTEELVSLLWKWGVLSKT